jgi:predicted adenylyl cyclase CyaB
MIELELKAVVVDAAALLTRLAQIGAREEFSGELIDLRFDYSDASLSARDEVIRVREYRGRGGDGKCSLEWKGPSSTAAGYKRREEIGVSTGDAATTIAILRHLGLKVTREIDRDIHQFSLDGATVRLERYHAMDDLVEVEGEPDAIETAIRHLGIPREQFSSDSLADFTHRYEARTGKQAATHKPASGARQNA